MEINFETNLDTKEHFPQNGSNKDVSTEDTIDTNITTNTFVDLKRILCIFYFSYLYHKNAIILVQLQFTYHLHGKFVKICPV